MVIHLRAARQATRWAVPCLVLAAGLVALSAQARFLPAQFSGGSLPTQSPLLVGGGEVFAELTVNAGGAVSSVKTLRDTPPFTDALRQAVQGWTFRAAEEEATSASGEKTKKPLASKVFVAGIFRAPAIKGPTLGEVPKDVSAASLDVPFPIVTETPPYPVGALAPGVVLIEVRIGADGKVTEAKVIRSDAAFDQAALDSARKWTFRPARIRGSATPVLAYLIFSFRPPITSAWPPVT